MLPCGARFSASQNSGGVLREAPASGQPCLRIDGMGRVSFRRRNMELVMGVVIWLMLVGGLLALFSDDGRGE